MGAREVRTFDPEIAPSSAEAILAHAMAAAPEEACGLVVRTRRGEAVVPCRNAAADPLTRYRIDPAELRAALDGPRPLWGLGGGHGAALVAIYHSHPRTAPRPTPADLGAAVAGAQYVIASIPEGRLLAFEASGV